MCNVSRVHISCAIHCKLHLNCDKPIEKGNRYKTGAKMLTFLPIFYMENIIVLKFSSLAIIHCADFVRHLIHLKVAHSYLVPTSRLVQSSKNSLCIRAIQANKNKKF